MYPTPTATCDGKVKRECLLDRTHQMGNVIYKCSISATSTGSISVHQTLEKWDKNEHWGFTGTQYFLT